MINEELELLTTTEVTELLKIKRGSMNLWIAKGLFPKPIKMGERLIRWKKSDISEWIAKKKEESRL